MFPLKDSIPRVHRTWAVWTIIGVNALVFLHELGLNEQQLAYLFHIWGVVPVRLIDPAWASSVGYPAGGMLTLVSSQFLHGGALHVIMNMWSMWIFADNIEDVMGPLRFTAFYLLCGAAAMAAHMFFNADSQEPVIGASGAIAGVMGAYFILYPRAKVLTLVPLFFIPLFFNLPAVLYLGIWFLSQLFSGVLSLGGASGGNIAWWAHAGGFLAGVALLPLFQNSRRCYYCYQRSDIRPRFGRHGRI